MLRKASALLFSLFKSQMFLNSLHRAIAEGHLLAESSPGRTKPQQTKLRGSADLAGHVSWLVASHFWGRLAPAMAKACPSAHPPPLARLGAALEA